MSRGKRWWPISRCTAVRGATLVALAASLIVAVAQAHFEVSHYTRPGNSCGNSVVDPNNVVFYGRHGYPSHGAHLMRKYGDGWTNSDGTSQSVWTHGECRALTGQRADDCGVCNRHHMRFFLNKGRVGVKYHTVSDAHTDVLTCRPVGSLPNCIPCHKNRTPSGSNDGRLIVANALRHAVPRIFYEKWGNNGGIKQCDGQKARSDGYVLYLGTG